MDNNLINKNLTAITRLINQTIIGSDNGVPTDMTDTIMTLSYYLRSIPEDLEVSIPLVNGIEIDIQRYRNNPTMLFNDIKRYEQNEQLFRQEVENKIVTQMEEQLTKLNLDNDLLWTNINTFKNVFVTHIMSLNLKSVGEFDIDCINNSVLLKLPNNILKVNLITEKPEECYAQF